MKQSQSLAPLGAASEHVSALCDGELDDRALDAWLAESRSRDEPLAQWQCYQLIGEVLRGQAVSPAASASREFLAALNEKLDAEQPPQVLVGATSPVPSVRGSAANDSVFRWKLVSGLASVVAVAAVGWTVLANAPQGASQGAPGPVLAQGSTAAATAKVAAAQPRAGAGGPAATRPVVVSTSQGKVLRDPALERLLAEHRQHGGMSAFQASTGFIRNATYDDDSR